MQTTLSHSSPVRQVSPKVADAAIGGGGRVGGLVLSSTSGKQGLSVNRRAGRLWRMRRSITGAAALHMEEMQTGGRRWKAAMVTLTYADKDAWQGRHVADYLAHLRKWSRRKGFQLRYCWVSEMQMRGAIHYHVLVWLPKGVTMPKADKQGWWPWGMTRTEWARHPVRYMIKYTSKGDTAELPKGARISGVGGLTGEALGWWRWHTRPLWLREIVGPDQRVTKPKGGGVFVKETGELLPPRWGLMAAAGQWVRIREISRQEWESRRLHNIANATVEIMRDQWKADAYQMAWEMAELRRRDYPAYVIRCAQVFSAVPD